MAPTDTCLMKHSGWREIKTLSHALCNISALNTFWFLLLVFVGIFIPALWCPTMCHFSVFLLFFLWCQKGKPVGDFQWTFPLFGRSRVHVPFFVSPAPGRRAPAFSAMPPPYNIVDRTTCGTSVASVSPGVCPGVCGTAFRPRLVNATKGPTRVGVACCVLHKSIIILGAQ